MGAARRPSTAADIRPPPFWIALLQLLRKAASRSNSPPRHHSSSAPLPLHQLLLDALRCSSISTHSLRYDHLPFSDVHGECRHGSDSSSPSSVAISTGGAASSSSAPVFDIHQDALHSVDRQNSPQEARPSLRSLLRGHTAADCCSGPAGECQRQHHRSGDATNHEVRDMGGDGITHIEQKRKVGGKDECNRSAANHIYRDIATQQQGRSCGAATTSAAFSNSCNSSSASSTTSCSNFCRCSSSTTSYASAAPSLHSCTAAIDANFQDSGEDRYSTAASSFQGINSSNWIRRVSTTAGAAGELWTDQSASDTLAGAAPSIPAAGHDLQLLMTPGGTGADLLHSCSSIWAPSTYRCPSSVSCFSTMNISEGGVDAAASSDSGVGEYSSRRLDYDSASFDSTLASLAADDDCRTVSEGSFSVSEFGITVDDRGSRCASFCSHGSCSRRTVVVSSHVYSDADDDEDAHASGAGRANREADGGREGAEERRTPALLRQEVVYAWDPVAELAANVVEVLTTWGGTRTEADVAAFLDELARLNAPHLCPATIALAFSRALGVLFHTSG